MLSTTISPQPPQSPRTRIQRSPGMQRLSLSVFLAVSASLAFSTGASAIETITLVFNESRVSVPFRDFQTFVKTGDTQRSELKDFFARIPKTAQAARTVLTREIVITRPFTEQNFKNPIANFLVLQLNKVLTPTAMPDNLEPLRTAVVASYRDDQRISMLELMSNYPEREMIVQLPRVERAYNRVNAFVERVQPALETAKLFLQDLVCDCPTASATPAVGAASEMTEEVSSASAVKAVSCP